jgi:hypothetical protein
VEDEDAEYLEFLAQQANGAASQATDDEEEEEEIGEEILFESPLDNVDPYITFAHAFKSKHFALIQRGIFQLLTTPASHFFKRFTAKPSTVIHFIDIKSQH